MNEDYIEKLVSDIQEFLREEDRHKDIGHYMVPDTGVTSNRTRNSLFVGILMLLSACAVGSITIAILLFGFIGNPSRNPVDTLGLLAVGACGIFFAAMLVSVWKRLVLLQQIEKNTRSILESKQRANALMEYFIERME
jgi:hypothetical protein